MKRTLFAIPITLLLLALCLTACAEETKPETFTSGDYEYILPENGAAEITGYWGKAENLTIPDQLDGHPVAAIGNSAFSFCSSLTSVSIPDSVTAIGANPFIYCKNLTKIVVSPDHPALAVIDGVLFSKPDKRLICYPAGKQGTAYQIPSGIQIIENFAFFQCSSLTSVSIPDSVTAIGNYAFYKCSSLTSVSIPDSVTEIGFNPFAYCKNLTKIIVSPDHPALAVIDGVLFSKPDKRLICYPMGKQGSTYQIPSGIQIIGEEAFYGCSSLTSVSIPDSVTVIGDSAFSACSSLTSVSIPDSVTAIGGYAFYDCSSLTSVSIPDSVTAIGDYAFFSCSSLTSVSIPDSVTAIGDSAFSDCSRLTSVSIPDSVTAIGDRAFSRCSSLTLTVGRDSYALQYCKENALNYTYPDSLDWLNN